MQKEIWKKKNNLITRAQNTKLAMALPGGTDQDIVTCYKHAYLYLNAEQVLNPEFRLVKVMSFLQVAQNSRIPGMFDDLYEHVLRPSNIPEVDNLATIFDKSETHYIPSDDDFNNVITTLAGQHNDVSDEF